MPISDWTFRRASLRIADSAYENSWYDGSQSYKKMILYIMMRAQKPFNLKAYKFHTLSLESFTDVSASNKSQKFIFEILIF